MFTGEMGGRDEDRQRWEKLGTVVTQGTCCQARVSRTPPTQHVLS